MASTSSALLVPTEIQSIWTRCLAAFARALLVAKCDAESAGHRVRGVEVGLGGVDERLKVEVCAVEHHVASAHRNAAGRRAFSRHVWSPVPTWKREVLRVGVLVGLRRIQNDLFHFQLLVGLHQSDQV